jgi:hypothetical protein
MGLHYRQTLFRYSAYILNEQPQGKPCGIDKIFCCLIDVTYSALPKYADYSQYKDVAEFSSKSILFTAAASRGVLNRIGFA